MNTTSISLKSDINLSTDATELLKSSMPENTKRAYKADLRKFAAFVGVENEQDLAEHTTVSNLVNFIAAEYQAGKKPTTIKRSVSSVRVFAKKFAPESNVLTDHGRDLTQSALAGVDRKRIENNQSTRSQSKSAISWNQLKVMVDRCDTEALSGKRDRAILLLGFCGGFRRSELASIRTEHISHVHGGIKIELLGSKSNQRGQRDECKLILKNDAPRYCPVRALLDWLLAAGIKEGYVFRQVFKTGKIRQDKALSDRSVANIVKDYAQSIGLNADLVAGHSLRSGFVTECYKAGVPENRIADVTGHQSIVVLRRYDQTKLDSRNHPMNKIFGQ